MEKIKKFFSITAKKYKFEIYDLTSAITVLNVILIVCGFWWAPIFGLFNCALFIGINFVQKAHINAWVSQIALVVLNGYFLTL